MELENSIFVTGFNWSVQVIVITLLTIAVLIGIIISFYSRGTTNVSLLKYVLTFVILLIIIIPAAYTPIRLSINDEKIVLKRFIGNIEINLKDVHSVTIFSNKEISNSIRTFGSGGLFGYLGQFNNNLIGNYTMYATETQNLIYIKTSKKKYVFSCSKPHEFIELVNKKRE